MAVVEHPVMASANQPMSIPEPVHDETEMPELLRQIGFEPTSVDCLVTRTGLSVDALLPQLLELELSGRIQAVAGGYIRLGG